MVKEIFNKNNVPKNYINISKENIFNKENFIKVYGINFYNRIDNDIFIFKNSDLIENYECFKENRKKEFISDLSGIKYTADFVHGKSDKNGNKFYIANNESFYILCSNPNCGNFQKINKLTNIILIQEKPFKHYCMNCFSSNHSCNDCIDKNICEFSGLMESKGKLNKWQNTGKCMTVHNNSDKMIQISIENGKNYGSKNMKKNHEKYDFELTCFECNDKECKSREKYILNNEYNTKKHIFLNNSCIDKMLTDEIRSKNASENNKKNWKNPEYAKKISSNLGDYLGNPEWARKVGINGRKALAKIFEKDPTFGRKIISEALKYLDKHPSIRKECGKRNIKKLNEKIMCYCNKCKKITIHNGYGTCLICNPKSISGGNNKYIIELNNVRFWKDELAIELVNDLLNGNKFFDDYPELENRKGHICYNKHDILTDDPIYFTNYLTDEDNIRWWKNERADELVKDLLSGKKDIKDYPQLEIKCNHVYYMNKDILSNEKIIYRNGISPLQIIDNIEFIHLPNLNKDITKEEFFKIKQNELENIDKNKEIDNLINNEGFIIEPIIKIDNETWSRKLTNQMLKEKGYKYICYIKLFKNKPFIVGITGTTLVHESEIDFDFIIGDNNDPSRTGIGRQFLREKYPEVEYTDFDYILCKNFETEKEAKEYEKYIGMKYNLFYS